LPPFPINLRQAGALPQKPRRSSQPPAGLRHGMVADRGHRMPGCRDTSLKPKIGPQVSHDAGDKLTAALNWYVARDKHSPGYVRAPHYFDAVLKWREELSPDHEDLLWTVISIYTTPRLGGETVAEKYAADLPPVPKPPDILK
jgi:hypothetical protein